MAEATGLAFALPGLFTAGVQCFEWVQFGREFKEDFATSSVQLELAQIRLMRWGTAVGLAHDSRASSIHLNFPEDDLETMSDLLKQIQQGFSRAERTATRFRSQASASDKTRIQELEALEPAQEMALATRSSKAFHSFSDEVRTQYRSVTAIGNKIAGKTSWVLYRRSHFITLISTVSGLVKELEELFPAVHARELELCRQEVSNITPADIPLLLEAVQDNDDLLREALSAEAEVQGITYDNIRIEGEARTRLGSEYGNIKVIEKSGNKYTNLVIGGKTVSHVGNSYGGASILADQKRV